MQQVWNDELVTSAKWTPAERPIGFSFTVNCRCIFMSSKYAGQSTQAELQVNASRQLNAIFSRCAVQTTHQPHSSEPMTEEKTEDKRPTQNSVWCDLSCETVYWAEHVFNNWLDTSEVILETIFTANYLTGTKHPARLLNQSLGSYWQN